MDAIEATVERRSERSQTAVYLSEQHSEIGSESHFFERMSGSEIQAVRQVSRILSLAADESVFVQGRPHNGIYLIEQGRVRTFYVGPSGKELTLAYWTPGHFVGGPEVFGGGIHMWSADTVEP